MRRCIYHTDLGQNAVFHNSVFKTNCTQSIFRTISRGLLAKPFKNFQNDLYGQLVLTFGKRQICSASCGRLFE